MSTSSLERSHAGVVQELAVVQQARRADEQSQGTMKTESGDKKVTFLTNLKSRSYNVIAAPFRGIAFVANKIATVVSYLFTSISNRIYNWTHKSTPAIIVKQPVEELAVEEEAQEVDTLELAAQMFDAAEEEVLEAQEVDTLELAAQMFDAAEEEVLMRLGSEIRDIRENANSDTEEVQETTLLPVGKFIRNARASNKCVPIAIAAFAALFGLIAYNNPYNV